MDQQIKGLPYYTKGEELFNAITHIIGVIFGFFVLIISLNYCLEGKDYWLISGVIIYGISLIIMYTMSSLYHFLSQSTAKKVFRIFDHCSIFLLIAGTYTPICFGPLMQAGSWGWIIFSIIWGFALLGVIFNAIIMNKVKILSMICYISMGWCAIFVIKPLLEVIDIKGFLWILAGGIIYTIGAILYIISKRKHLKYMHAVWHLFVLGGSVVQFIGLLLYIII